MGQMQYHGYTYVHSADAWRLHMYNWCESQARSLEQLLLHLQEAKRFGLSVFRVFATGGEFSGFVLQPGPGISKGNCRTHVASMAGCMAAVVMAAYLQLAINMLKGMRCCFAAELLTAVQNSGVIFLHGATTRRCSRQSTTCLPRLATMASRYH